MRAVIADAYGAPEVLRIVEFSKPTPKSNEVLIRVKAASLNSGDVRMRSLDAGDGLKGAVSKLIVRLLLGIIKPKNTPGSVFSGIVEAVGEDFSRFKVGDEVFATTGMDFGAFAEYCVLSDKQAIALKPKNASFEEASTLPFGGNAALYFLRKADIAIGKKVFIYGSTGAVGASAVQVSK
ncbi:alcohol dehydrogenase catalytic domain-containing protein, partial [Candidatus Kaiserbacteria bacterium]|nr:alcohol dehydrogenase catalytic domain-containing protein [Candidatus Kaiserbacteria bacterium]